MVSANIYTSAPHYQIFHNKKLELFKSFVFVTPQVTQCPIRRFSPLNQKRNTKYLLYILHLLIQIFYIIPIYYTLIVNTLQTKTSDAPHNTLKNMPSKRWQTSLSILTIFSLKPTVHRWGLAEFRTKQQKRRYKIMVPVISRNWFPTLFDVFDADILCRIPSPQVSLRYTSG